MFLARQTDLFEGKDLPTQKDLRIENLEKVLSNVQRGLFARNHRLEGRIAEQEKIILDLKEELAKIREMMIKQIK